jgi:5-methylcytosine-specific restriction endonuclease McrA
MCESKTCTGCKETKPLLRFRFQKTRNRYSAICIECIKLKDRAYQQSETGRKIRQSNSSQWRSKELQKKRDEAGVISFQPPCPITIIKCVVCDTYKTFKGSSKRGRACCSKECAIKYSASKMTGRTLPRSISAYKCRTCSELFVGKAPGNCNTCREVRMAELKKAQKRSRRAATRMLKVQNVIDTRVFDRDKWRCCACKSRVQKTDIYADDAAELDHIVPLSLGGPHSYSNTQTLCRRCNREKSNKYAGQLVMAI